ncbi:reticulon-3 isoform X1 [Syngnathus acus]|uniref:reticulon-3 isoform X1 n=1 Tax=Syngnathus acus TaxID=161584 RepID=UPI0018864EBE|nr:reticulon-3 isoform X1 [Syngnathus acus]
MDPMTQSAQISSSQGLADGQNSALKESRPSDRVLSSPPVSFIRPSQDVKTLPCRGKGDQGLATSLRFSSQPGSFSPDTCAQPESPIKTSPVSERIKALEALAAKKETYCPSDFSSHHRDKVPKLRQETKGASPDWPFEVLGERRQMNAFEESEARAKAPPPSVADWRDAADGGSLQGGLSSAFKPPEGNPASPPLCVPDNLVEAGHDDVEEADFAPTADGDNRAPRRFDWEHPTFPSPPDDGARDAPHGDKNAEAQDLHSSAESDERLAEDAPSPKSDCHPSSDIATSPATADAERVPAPRWERTLMQVPAINVIESQEPNCSDDELQMEFEDDELVEEAVQTARPEENKQEANRRPVQSEFMEGYSPPSSPVESDGERLTPPPAENKFKSAATSWSQASKDSSGSGEDDDSGAARDVATVSSRIGLVRDDTYEGRSFESAFEPSAPKDDDGGGFAADVETPHAEDPEPLTGCDSGAASEPVDSFVEFMRECLKSRPGEDEQYVGRCPPATPQDQLPLEALKRLGGSQEAGEERLPSAPCSQSDTLGTDCTLSQEVDAWVAEARHLAERVLTAMLSHLSVKDLIHWRDPKKSGLVFGLSMLLLLSLAAFSVISVVSYLLLALLCVTITFRIYKSVVQAVQKSGDGHPFKSLIDKDVSIPPETFRKHVDSGLTYINRALKQMSRLFLVEDLVDSLKLAVVMWLLTYVGAVFNGITILILTDILLFAVPPIYEKNKTQIDQYVDLARTQIDTTVTKLQEKLPGAVKRSKTE